MPDLLIRAEMGNGILVALGPFKENEPIALSHEIDFALKGFVIDFAVADWDRDGKPDLLVRQTFRPLKPGGQGGGYLLGTGTSVEKAWPNWPRGSSSLRMTPTISEGSAPATGTAMAGPI